MSNIVPLCFVLVNLIPRFYLPGGTWQFGKKVLATIFDAWPLVTVLLGLK